METTKLSIAKQRAENTNKRRTENINEMFINHRI
jgi:hypothetical protein